MKGNNSLIWCEAQMIAAIEAYLNEHMFQESVSVSSVKRSGDSFNNQFEISLEERKEPPR